MSKINVSGAIEKDAAEQLKRYGKITGFGHCRLVALGAYIMIGVFRGIEEDFAKDGKNIDDLYRFFDRHPFKAYLRPINNLLQPTFDEDLIISPDLRDEILQIITAQKVRVVKSSKGGQNGN